MEDLDAELHGALLDKSMTGADEEAGNSLMARVGAIAVRAEDKVTGQDTGNFKIVALPGSAANQ